MIGLLIAGIVGMIVMLLIGVCIGRFLERDRAKVVALEAAKIVIEKEHQYLMNKLKGIAV